FELAADKLEHYARGGTDDDAPPAMMRAAAIREALGAVELAVADLVHVIDTLGAQHSQAAADARLELAALYARAGRRDEAIDTLRQYVARVGEAGGAERLMLASARLAEQ